LLFRNIFQRTQKYGISFKIDRAELTALGASTQLHPAEMNQFNRRRVRVSHSSSFKCSSEIALLATEEMVMRTSLIVASAVTAAVSLPVATLAGPAAAPSFKAEKCYGVAAAGQNDCQTASHSCAGESRKAAAGDSWIYVPAGTCMKINGGSLSAK
jgi:uncharacterized membrane protein